MGLFIRLSEYIKEGGYIGLFIIQVPKFYNKVFLFGGLTCLGTFVNCDWLVHEVHINSTERVILCIIIRDVQHCLIPLDPWNIYV